MGEIEHPRAFRAFSWGLAVAGFVPLILLSRQLPLNTWFPLLFLVPLALAADFFALQMPGNVYLSLENTVCLFCALLLGPRMAAWTAGLSIILDELILLRRGPHFAARSGGMYVLMWLAGGLAYQAVGGTFPLMQLGAAELVQALVLFLVVVLINRTLMVMDQELRGHSAREYLTSTAPRTALIEMGLAPAGAVMAVVYTRVGPIALTMLVFVLLLAFAVVRQLKRLSDTLVQRVAALDTLNRVGRRIGSYLDLAPVLELIHAGASHLVDTSTFWIVLHDRDRNELVYEVLYDRGRQYPPSRWPYEPGVGLTAYLLERQEPVLTHNLEELRRLPIQLAPIASGQLPESVLGVPMMAKGKVLGAISAQSYRPNAFSQEDLETLITLANQAAIAVENARLFRKVEQGQQYLRAVLDGVDHAVVVTNLDGVVCLANRAMEALFGVPEAAAVGRPLEEVAGHKALFSIAQRIGQGQITGPEALQVELSDGRALVTHVAPVTDQGGTRTGYVVAMADITALHELSQLRSRIIRMASHDLRNPLHLAGGFLHVLLEDLPPLTKQQSLLAQRVLNHLGAMERLIDNLFELERVGEARAPHREPLDVGPLVQEVLRSQRMQAELKQHRLRSEVDEDIPPVLGDASMLSHALANLVDNAVKYTPTGGDITVRVWAEEGEVVIRVEDTGVGIPPDAQGRVFDQFYRARQPGTEHISGTGLGLSLVQAIVQQHGGRVWVESAGVPGEGTVFGLALPTL